MTKDELDAVARIATEVYKTRSQSRFLKVAWNVIRAITLMSVVVIGMFFIVDWSAWCDHKPEGYEAIIPWPWPPVATIGCAVVAIAVIFSFAIEE